MASLLHAGPDVSESLFGQLVQVLSAQTQLVAFIGMEHLLEDVLVIRRVAPCLWTVNKALNLMGAQRTAGCEIKSLSKVIHNMAKPH